MELTKAERDLIKMVETQQPALAPTPAWGLRSPVAAGLVERGLLAKSPATSSGLAVVQRPSDDDLELYRSAVSEGGARVLGEAILIAKAHSVVASDDAAFQRGYQQAVSDIVAALEAIRPGI